MVIGRLQAVGEGDTFIEYEAGTGPEALFWRNRFDVLQNATFKVIDLFKSALFKKRGGLLTANSASAEHRNLAVP